MNDLIKIEEVNGMQVVRSRVVAEELGKDHKDVCNKIREVLKIGVGENFPTPPESIETTYINEQNGQEYKEYLVTKKGFTLLVMNYTGYNDFKRAYIDRFDELERRYNHITEQANSFDMMRMMIDKMEENEKMAVEAKVTANTAITKVEALEHKLDIKVGKNYVKANNVATLLGLFSESGKPHAQFVGAIAKHLGMKIGFRNYFEDDYITIVKQEEQWEIYYKPLAVEKIETWFNKNREDLYFAVLYQQGTKKGQIKMRGYKMGTVNYYIK